MQCSQTTEERSLNFTVASLTDIACLITAAFMVKTANVWSDAAALCHSHSSSEYTTECGVSKSI